MLIRYSSLLCINTRGILLRDIWCYATCYDSCILCNISTVRHCAYAEHCWALFTVTRHDWTTIPIASLNDATLRPILKGNIPSYYRNLGSLKWGNEMLHSCCATYAQGFLWVPYLVDSEEMPFPPLTCLNTIGVHFRLINTSSVTVMLQVR